MRKSTGILLALSYLVVSAVYATDDEVCAFPQGKLASN